MEPAFAYVLGVLCGDGYTIKGRNRIGLRTTNEDFANLFDGALKTIFPSRKSYRHVYFPKKKNHNPVYIVALTSKDFLPIVERYGKFNTKEWGVPQEIFESSDFIKMCFLSGFFDSEGNVNKHSKSVNCYSTNILGLEGISKLLTSLGIEHSIYRTRKCPSIYIRRSCLRFFNAFLIPEKMQKLDDVKRSLPTTKTRCLLSHEALKKKVIELRKLGLSMREIRKEVRCRIDRVVRILREEIVGD